MVISDRVGVLGARGQTGSRLVPMLASRGVKVAAFTRADLSGEDSDDNSSVRWHSLSSSPPSVDTIVSTIPVWELGRHFDLIAASGARRIVALSSTSLFTKEHSPDDGERRLARLLESGERNLQMWAENAGLEWTILRSTMIYGLGRDHNVSSLLRFIERFGFLPVLGKAGGLRQPVHVDDVAAACVAALESPVAGNRAYNLSGGETLSYREMCTRLFTGLGRRPGLIAIPVWILRILKPLNRLLPERLRWMVPMFERMNTDLVFDHNDATRDFGFEPRPFKLTAEDLKAQPSRIIP